MKVLLVPAELHPCHESFLEEVFTRGDLAKRCTFLMRASDDQTPPRTTWNDALVFTLPRRFSSRWLRAIRVYATDLRYVPTMWRLLRTIRPDLVLVRDMTFPLVLALATKPFFGHAVVFQKTFPNELRWFDPEWVRAHRFPWLWIACRRVEDWTLHILMSFCEATIPITRYMGFDLQRKWGHDPDRTFPFGMGIDPGEPPAERPAMADESPIRLVYVGTLARSRRLERMIDAFALVQQASPKPLRMTILGGTPEQVEFLRQRARERNVGDLVDLRGLVPRAQVYSILREHHAGIAYIPADPRFRVASPTKVIECLALGLPVAATDAVAVNFDLADMTGAVVIGNDSVDGFASALETLVRDLPELTRRAREHRERVVDEYDYCRMRARVWAILERIVSERHRHGEGPRTTSGKAP